MSGFANWAVAWKVVVLEEVASAPAHYPAAKELSFLVLWVKFVLSFYHHHYDSQ